MSEAIRRRGPSRKGFVFGVSFRLAALTLGLLPLVAAESAFTILDWGRPEINDDPFVGFRTVRPLFTLNSDTGRYEIAPPRLDFFRPDSFAAEKPAGEFRIFCLGGSTVQGRPFAIETSFTTWLEISLQAADPSRTWEVVNCGGVSYASYRLVPILEEILRHQPDLVLLYTGHNEFLEDRTYRHVKNLPAAVAWPCQQVAKTRTFVLLNRAFRHVRGDAPPDPSKDRPLLPAEVAARLDTFGGLALYHRDETWRRETIEHFRYNLGRMAEMCRRAGVPLVLVNPVANLRDCPPFKSENRDGLDPAALARWRSLLDAAGASTNGPSHPGVDRRRSLELLQQAAAIDDRHAGLHYLLAECCDDLGMFEEARASYIQAKELDVCPLRILEPMHEAILATARRERLILVDVRRFYESQCEGGIPGSYMLVDHVHPSIAGHQRIADLVADQLVAHGFLRPIPEWHAIRDRRRRAHLESLDDLYFAKGEQRLEMLRRWTQGTAGRRSGAAD